MNGRHIAGIDYLRGFMSIAVVALHIEGIGIFKSLIFHNSRYIDHSFGFSDFINFHLLLSAVPVFIVISCFLFTSKSPSLKDFMNKTSKIFLLFVFWSSSYIIWMKSYA